MSLTLAVLLIVASLWGSAAWVARTERRAEASRRFHRHALRRHRRDLAEDLAALVADPAAPVALPAAPRAALCPVGRSLAPSPPRPVCRARRPADGSPDQVRERVFHELARHPYQIGHLVTGEGRGPWRRVMIGCPRHGGYRPALFVTVWGVS